MTFHHMLDSLAFQKFDGILTHVKGHAGSSFFSFAIFQLVAVATITDPTNGVAALFGTERIDDDFVGDHKCGVETHTELAD